MRLDLDLIRLVMLETEGHEWVDLGAYTEDQINYHRAQLIDAGYAEGYKNQGLGQIGIPETTLSDLTWEGHQFLANARNDLFWKKAMRQLAKAGGSASIDIISALLAKVAASMLTN